MVSASKDARPGGWGAEEGRAAWPNEPAASLCLMWINATWPARRLRSSRKSVRAVCCNCYDSLRERKRATTNAGPLARSSYFDRE
jgi:hypothetical protein